MLRSIIPMVFSLTRRGWRCAKRKLKKIPVGKLIVLYRLREEGVESSEEALELRRLGHARKNAKVFEGSLITPYLLTADIGFFPNAKQAQRKLFPQ